MSRRDECTSRRAVIKQGLTCLGLAATAPLMFYSRNALALTKELMNYTDNGPGTGPNPGYCIDCKSFVTGASGGAGTCLVVTGSIQPKGHCDGWSKKVHDAPEK